MKQIEPLNFLRQAAESFNKANVSSELGALQQALLGMTMHKHVPKFVLPEGGRIFNDELKGLPEKLRLPFPVVVIEYKVSGESVDSQQQVLNSFKRIAVAKEGENDIIEVFSIFHETDSDSWFVVPASAILNGKNAGCYVNSKFQIGLHSYIKNLPGWDQRLANDLADEAIAVCELIEALSCSNVSHEALPVRKLNKSAAKRGAKPFDEYRILTVSSSSANPNQRGGGIVGDRRSPREHLRRGHIRVLQDKRKIWVQSTVVNAGTSGRVFHDYDLRKMVA